MTSFNAMKKWWLVVPALLVVGFLTLRFAGTKNTEASGLRPRLRLDSLHEAQKHSKYYDAAQRIDALYKSYNKQKGYNCAVLVARGSDVLLARGYGYADYRNKKQLDAHTSFRLASVSKPITATAALMLFDQGKLDLQKPVSDYLPAFPYENITVEMLLCHRSGLPNYMYFAGDYLRGTRPSVVTNDDVLRMLIDHKPSLKFKPGKRFQYCNTNYSLLVNIVEKQSGQPFDKFLQDNIFTPMEMNDSYLITSKECTDNVACAYTYGFEKIGDDYLDGVVGDKGISCSVMDLYKFHMGLERGLLLKPDTRRMAYTPRSFEKKGDKNYGYGWRIKATATDTAIYHNGWWHGFNNVFYRRPSDSTVVIVLSNKLNMGVYKIDKLLNILDGNNKSFDADENESDDAVVKPVKQKTALKKATPSKKQVAKKPTAKKKTAKAKTTQATKKSTPTKPSATKVKPATKKA